MQKEVFPWFQQCLRTYDSQIYTSNWHLYFEFQIFIFKYPQSITIWIFQRYHKSAYSKPSSSFPQTWSFCCTFHFNKRLHIPFSQQRLSSYSPSLSSPILSSWSRPPLSTNPSFQVLLISRTDTCSELCFSHVFLQFIFTTGSQPGWFCLLEDIWQRL